MVVRYGTRGERADVSAPKIRVPSAHHALVPRERLFRLLDPVPRGGGCSAPDITMVCAPAGSGKTILLSAWADRLHRRRGAAGSMARPVAWVSLDSDDNDLFLLWSAVLAALQATGAWGNDGPLHWLSPPRTAMEQGFLAALTDALDAAPEPVWLVLDDVHELHDPASLHSLDLLVRRTPPKLRIVLSGRTEPPLATHRLRLDGRLTEIDVGDLTFTRDEAEQLLSTHHVHLAETDLDLLLERTEGWAAGLRLAAMSLVDGDDAAALVANFAGDDRAVADYLVREILARQPEHIQRFLLTTSVCEQFTIDLASVLSGREDAGEILDGLERANALIVRLGHNRQWYRYHALLRGYLRAELHRRQVSLPRRLHHLAAEWFAVHGNPLTALEHAIASGEADLAAGLLERHGLPLVLGGGGAPLRRMLDELSPDVLSRPHVALVAAAAALDVGDVTTADARLERSARGPADDEPPRLRALRAAVALHRARLHGDLPAAMATLASVRGSHTGDQDVDLMAELNMSISHVWLGDPDAAEAGLQRALALARASGRDNVALQCLTNLGGVSASKGQLVDMSCRAEAALEFAEDRGWARTSHCSFACVLAGWGAYQRLDPVAGAYAARALELLEGQTDTTIELSALSLNAIVAFDTAEDRHAVVADLRAAWHRLGRELMAPALVAYATPYEQRMSMRVGEFDWADETVTRAHELIGAMGEVNLLRAVMLAQKGRADFARRILRPVLSADVETLVTTTLVDAWLLEATLVDAAGDQRRAHEAVVAALEVAEPVQALRAFVEAGHPVRALLARGAGRFGRHEGFATRALAAVPAMHAVTSDILTRRELDLLAELPSMRTTGEIADLMCVSANTVKTHLRAIYRKLRVGNRRDAIAVARQRGLL